MSLVDLTPKTQEVERGLLRLNSQRRKLAIVSAVSGVLLLTAILSLVYLKPMLYGFFGLSLELTQLHIPTSFSGQFDINHQGSDAFFNLISWVGWLILKLSMSFFVAFLFVRLLRKIPFFAVRLKRRLMRLVAWCIGFILIWSGLSFWQYESTRQDPYVEWTQYDRHIDESLIAQVISDSQVDEPVAAYMLAQTALLHQPADTAAAIPHVLSLVRAEIQNQNFVTYGFQPEQLWVMQQQLYGKSLTPLTKHIDRQAQQAENLYQVAKYGLWVLNLLLAIVFITTQLLTRHMHSRMLRIESYLN